MPALSEVVSSLASVLFLSGVTEENGGLAIRTFSKKIKDIRYKNTHLQEVILFEANILYIESFLHYIITTKDKEYKIKESISAFEQK